MIAIGFEMLDEVGMGALSAPDKVQLLRVFKDALEDAVGRRLAARMSEAQLEGFERAVARCGESREPLLRWLEKNAPDHEQVVQRVFDELLDELRAAAPEIARSCVTA